MDEARLAVVMDRLRELFVESKLSLDELGQRMGYSGDSARKSAWQFLNKSKDPRLSMLVKYAEALQIDVRLLFGKEASDE
jgi:transcriptional regulator with XRE-family HTH domain